MKSTIPQIVVTGSSGYLGQYLLSSLIHQPLLSLASSSTEIQVHALYGGNMKGFPQAVQSMVDAQGTTLPKMQVQVHKLDLTNADDVQAWVAHYGPRLDLCVHAAALSVPRQCEADPVKAQALNVPNAFLGGLAKHAVSIIALSTDQVYDGTAAPYLEERSVAPLNKYGATKVELEGCLRKLQSSVPTVALRSSIMLGPKAPMLGDQAHATFLHFCAGRQDQETTFYTDECRSVVAVDNVVHVIRWFATHLLTGDNDKDVAGVYNMGGPEGVSRYDMAQAVFRHFGYAEESLVAAEKATLPPQEVQSPLDITMDSAKLYRLVGDAVHFKGIKDIVSWTFAATTKRGK